MVERLVEHVRTFDLGWKNCLIARFVNELSRLDVGADRVITTHSRNSIRCINRLEKHKLTDGRKGGNGRETGPLCVSNKSKSKFS